MGKLQSRVALITGGGHGIGRGIAEVLSREGARVVVGDINAGNAADVAVGLESTGTKALAVELDVANPESAAACMEGALAAFGQIDILVNNAGVLGPRGFSEVRLEDWDRCYEVNLKGVWIMTRAVLPHMTGRGGGKVVNIASIAGRHGGAVHPHYSASKAGAISLTQSLAAELGPLNINVNAVCPGLVQTGMWPQLEAMVNRRQGRSGEWIRPFIARQVPLRREQTAEDIGMAVAFLASDEARNITGQALNVDGGLEMN